MSITKLSPSSSSSSTSSTSAPPLVNRLPINISEYEDYARATLPKPAYDYYRSGAADEITLEENRKAFNRILIRPRFMVDVSRIECE